MLVFAFLNKRWPVISGDQEVMMRRLGMKPADPGVPMNCEEQPISWKELQFRFLSLPKIHLKADPLSSVRQEFQLRSSEIISQ